MRPVGVLAFYELACEEHGFIIPGTVIAADNVIFPGAPDYMN
jgi:predicted O-methyltransferase YrrM